MVSLDSTTLIPSERGRDSEEENWCGRDDDRGQCRRDRDRGEMGEDLQSDDVSRPL